MNGFTQLRAGASLAAAIAFVALIAVPRAQQAEKPQEPKPAQEREKAPEPKPVVPLAASTVSAHPDPYYGEPVSITATVAKSLSPTAFSVTEPTVKSSGDVLVLAPRLNNPVAPNAYVTVLGDLVKFDAAKIGEMKNYKLDLPPDLAAQYAGRPTVLAKSVITSEGIDLAMRLPPPLSPQEEGFQKVMKRVGPAFAAVRTGVTESKADSSKEHATALKDAFGEAEAFWKTRNRADAVGWAQDARKQAEAIDKAAAAGNWDEAKKAAGELGQQCQSCHREYRERFDDGSFRIKMPEKPAGGGR
jgi:soluble cytochrome b562